MRFVLLVFFLLSSLRAEIVHYETGCPAARSKSFRILDSVELRFSPRHGVPFEGVSGLTYDRKRHRLYAVSDRGWLYTLKPLIENMKIEKVRLKEAVSLKDEKGRTLEGKKWRDAEGLAMAPDGLLVSFERNPRVVLYRTDGTFAHRVELPKSLKKKRRYRGKNSMLEAVARHPRYGLVTAPERPLKGEESRYHTIFAKKQRWRFRAAGSLTAMEVTEKGNFLIMERSFEWLTGARTIRLSLLYPEECHEGICRIREVATLESEAGCRLDNFEGLTRLGGNLYLMISDDNGSPFQKTLLVLFEIPE